MKYKVFVDGQEGTTGLQIHERLAGRDDLEVLKIAPEKRKDTAERRQLLNAADIVFLCLPDEASIESVSMVTNEHTKIIDASTAFRTAPDWVYGLPELSKEQREAIKNSKRVSNPGCHATGFNVAIYPLVKEGILPVDYPVSATSLTGYSGGGKKLIEKYETGGNSDKLRSPNVYGLALKHKHIPEMQKTTGLTYPPTFVPVLGNYYKGMTVSIPLNTRFLNKKLSAKELRDFMASYYAGEQFIKVMPYESDYSADNGFFDAVQCNDTNRIELFVFGRDEQILILTRFDNLGKGASGAAVQNMNIMLGLDEKLGLVL
jgi:N-acetyl-gamma-glutamyl-phosphate reductase